MLQIIRTLSIVPLCFAPVLAAAPMTSTEHRLDELEARLLSAPDDLRLGAEYRHLIITTAHYDRSIKFFERLSKDPRGGANRFVNLALAYVDKIPVAGSIRQALLGRDVIGATSHAIEIQADPVAYLIRGLVNLYYDRAMFHRTDKGVSDLEQARKLAALNPAYPMERIFVALGNGYWRWNQPAKAREIWHEGFTRYPDSARLRRRVNANDVEANELVERALDPGVRVDTTLREYFPDLPVVVTDVRP